MPEPTIRPGVIALWRRVDPDQDVLRTSPNLWTVDGGRLVTAEERDLLLSANGAELQAARDLSRAITDSMLSEAEAMHEVVALLMPYWSKHPEAMVVEAVAQLDPEQRERAEYLLRECLPAYIEVPRNPPS
jgi:hypothetical protein